MEARVFYRDEMLDEDHCYSTYQRMLEDDPRPLATAVVYEVDEAGTPNMGKPLATWNGFLKRALTKDQERNLMAVALNNYIEEKPQEEPSIVREGWANLWADYTPCEFNECEGSR